jgi:Protein of unknown function (DUF2891)
LLALGEPILAAVARRDTDHPVFAGCYDWHSAVHGVYALLVLSRLTGRPDHARRAEEVLRPPGLAAEGERLASGALDRELPYGFAWLLHLSREDAGRRPALAALGEAAAARLEGWLSALSGPAVEAGVRAGDYANLAWPLLNLVRWAEARGETARAEATRDRLRAWLLPIALGWGDEACGTEFFPPGLLQAHTIAEALPPDEAAAWLAPRTPSELPAPLHTPRTVHHTGQGFTRAWGLWSLFRATGDPAYLASHEDHLEGLLTRRELWATDYARHSHWVPQLGVEALRLALDDAPLA